jgi:hypothetical protein
VSDPTFGDPVARRIRDELARGSTETVRRVLATTADPDLRSFYVSVATDWPGRPGWLDAWVAAEPRCAEAHLLRGVHGIGWAWEARGAARADHTGRDRFALFFERLGPADADLQKAADLAPRDPEPWAHLVTTARGLQLGKEDLARRFMEVIARHPWHRRAHTQMLQGLARKWSGSHTLMFNFARERALTAPEGSPLGGLIVEAHFEMWIDLDSEPEQDAYFRNLTVLAELHAAADRSVRSPYWRPYRHDGRAHNLFAAAFALAGDFPAAAHQFAAAQGQITQEPWNHLGGEDAFHQQYRRVTQALRTPPHLERR